ncbi:MAG: cation:proton antiporter, partial [Candidatus Calescibacterium sp.]|nr:cation:proton antiporter [Candidatus Calescibacterium sp.]MDW8132817.1 cation:proton antiporter [Candidatus Calescibacterium sp.]
ELILKAEWLKVLSSLGAIFLTFLAGTEVNIDVIKNKSKEVLSVGLLGFLAPFIGCFLVALLILKWNIKASLITGIALSTTSVAVVYTVMYNYNLNQSDFGKGILASCFINDLATVLALSLIFSPFNYKTLIFLFLCIISFIIIPKVSKFLINKYSNKGSAFRVKWIKFILIILGAVALWSGNEPILPAYIMGMILSDTVTKDENFMKRLRSITIGILTPFYFIKAGFLLSIKVILSFPSLVIILLFSKVLSKIIGLYPIVKIFIKDKNKSWYYTMMMSTGLTFGTISALYGLTHNIINLNQYSLIVVSVILSAIIPTLIANSVFLPKFLFKK